MWVIASISGTALIGVWAGCIIGTIGLVYLVSINLPADKRQVFSWHGGPAMSRTSMAIIGTGMLLNGGAMVASRISANADLERIQFLGIVLFGLVFVASIIRDEIKSRKA
jgi:hypothetical protein